MLQKLKEYQFLLEELIKRDFKKKYKRTVLGVFWSVLSPLLTLFVMKLVFTGFFGNNIPFYTTYLFAGNLIFSYYRESTTQGMSALMNNADIFSKVNVPKYMFVLSSNLSSMINFLITLVVFFVFAAIDGVTFSWRFLVLIYPVACLLLFNIGVGLILSAMFVFFRDTQYLYSVFTLLLMYVSAIFYQVTSFPLHIQRLFLMNPIYVYIKYFRVIVIDGNIPSLAFNLLPLFWAAAALLIGGTIYKKNNQRFMYYV
ncbi:MAG: ABC transporter permease [Clostridiales bacterium]|nr:ABC transporter permease [Clostridiales bacterium]